MKESSPTTIAPLLLRNILTSLFVFTDKSFLGFTDKSKLLHLLRYFLVSAFLYCLRLLPLIFSSLNLSSSSSDYDDDGYYSNSSKPTKSAYRASDATDGRDSGIARALSQVLSIINEIPVSSRKYEVVRSLAERLIQENLQEGYESLREVNFRALSAAFARTLVQLEASLTEQERGNHGGDIADESRTGGGYRRLKLDRVLRAVWYYGDVAWTQLGSGRSREELSRLGSSAEKLAAEVLWLAQKLTACGFAEEAVCRWASASNLARLSLSAEPRLQGSLVKVTAFLFKQAKCMGGDEGEEIKVEQQRQTKMKMLVSWLPLLCRASNGTDAPVLSFSERAELEKVLEEIIETLDQDEEQEIVLSLWLHHFTYCPSSDWPNLHACYTRWCTASRKLLLFQ